MIGRGTTVGRYTVLDRLGAGGMGVVYAAHDPDLDRRVALKFPSFDPDRASGLRERFLEEARSASSLDHPNICTIHEIGETSDGRLFIAMGLYEGTTLREMLSKGPLSPEQARQITLQVARGLEHAHRQGIVHRDIKPENLLLTEDGVVKILDFGIAKREGNDARQKERRLGTMAYMSPEQLRGTALDGRADIWALGAVLYEILTGEQPFEAREPAAVQYRILNSEPRELKGRSNTIPPDLRRVLQRYLAKQPSARYQAARELVAEIEAALTEIRIPTIRDRIRRRPRLATAIAAGLLLIPVAVAAPPGRRLAEQVVHRLLPAAPRYVAVLSFSSTDSAGAALAAGLTESFTKLVAQLSSTNDSLWVLPFTDMLDAEAGTPTELRRVYPVDLVVTGELRRIGTAPQLDLDLFDLRRGSPRVVSSLEIEDPSSSLSSQSARQLMARALRLPGTGLFGRLDGSSQAVSPAQRYYLLGVGQLRREYDVESIEAAINLFHTAVSVDPSYAPAYAGLCEALWEKYIRGEEAATANEAQRMCAESAKLSLSDPSTLVALGKSQWATGQLAQAAMTLRDAVQRNGGADAHRWLGHVLEAQGDLEGAEQEYKAAIALREDIWLYYADLGMLYTYSERHEEAMELHREVIRLSPDNYRGYNDLGASLMLSNRLQEAEEQFRASIAARPSTLAYRNLGYLHLISGRYDEAVEVLREGISFRDQDWWSWRWLAHAYHWRGDSALSEESWRQVVQKIEPRLEVNPNDPDLLCGIAEALVLLGDRGEAQPHLDLLASLDLVPYNAYWIGRVYEMLGSRRAALRYVTRALEMGWDQETVERDPWLDALRADPAFQARQR